MADLDDLLTKTSRTFALSIPLLPEPTRRQVTLGYLLFRIADTFEDAAEWPNEQRIEALSAFSSLLEEDAENPMISELARKWSKETPIDHDGYQELLEEIPAVLQAFFDLEPRARSLVRDHVTRTAKGMIEYVERTDEQGELQLEDIDDLREYCYVVAGIVGEMLTELFILDRPELEPVADDLRIRARRCGEAQQLVNILKDSAFDATEGRSYLAGAKRSEVFDLARADLRTAAEYILLLQGSEAERGLVAFNALPVLLAFAALDRVETAGPGSKVTREQLYEIMERLERDLDAGRPVVSLDHAASPESVS